MTTARSRRSTMTSLILAGVLVDWALKQWVLASLLPAASWVVIPGVLNITRTHNTGAAFSLFQEHPSLLLVSAMVTLTVMTVYIVKNPRLSGRETLGFACVFAGALGNMLDRVVYGSVTDFINLVLIHFPVFNFADMLICTGVSLLLLQYAFSSESKPKTDAAPE